MQRRSCWVGKVVLVVLEGLREKDGPECRARPCWVLVEAERKTISFQILANAATYLPASIHHRNPIICSRLPFCLETDTFGGGALCCAPTSVAHQLELWQPSHAACIALHAMSAAVAGAATAPRKIRTCSCGLDSPRAHLPSNCAEAWAPCAALCVNSATCHLIRSSPRQSALQKELLAPSRAIRWSAHPFALPPSPRATIVSPEADRCFFHPLEQTS